VIGYGLAIVSYVILGLLFKTAILNWIVGPVYLLVVLHVIPEAVRRVIDIGAGGARR
jgi:hypothetical protein